MIRHEWFLAAALAVASGVAALAATGDPIADLKTAVAALQSKNQNAAALAALRPLAKTLPKLSDYVAWFTATAESNLENYPTVPNLLEPLLVQSPPSPLIAPSPILRPHAYDT